MKRSKKTLSRREFVKQSSLTGLGAALAISGTPTLFAKDISAETPAIMGGQPVRTKDWPAWPRWNPETDEEGVIKVLRSGVWSRADVVDEFEKKWAETIGSKRCLSVVNGTSALAASVVQMDIGAGDEVIVTPYTWISTVQSILLAGAMPVFADIDPETYQIDPKKIEEKITPRTRLILPVHILGLPADMITIMDIAKRHNLLVLEDACQAWLAEINHKKVATFGNAGCFSFQNSKHIPMGEGGAIVSDDDNFIDRCYSYHNVGFPYGTAIGSVGGGSVMLGTKLRLTEYQAAIGLAMLKRLDTETTVRNENAAYLQAQISQIPGIKPYRLYDNVTRAAFHVFAYRYKKEEFKGLPRKDFIKAVNAEGISCFNGYPPNLNNQPYLAHAFQTKNFRKMYTPEMLDINKFTERNKCPENELLCDEIVWMMQNMLVGPKSDMDDIAMAINKVYQNADKIKKSLS